MSGIFEPLWLLYVDLNTRVNILLDDAASVQQLSLRYVEDRLLLDDLLKDKDGQPRRWKHAKVAAERKLRSRDRALLEVWRMMGNAAHTLEKLREQCAGSFASAVARCGPSTISTEVKSTAAIAIFIAQRHFLISQVADKFLSQLRLAREKLQQILENRPGALPVPLAQRRWASSFYLDFLGSYSFRLRRDVAFLCKALEAEIYDSASLSGGMNKLDDVLYGEEDVFHGVGYESASFTYNERFTKDEQYQETPAFSRQLTVASSYFYPEQPSLLPLLAHEFAHHYQSYITEHSADSESFDSWFLELSQQLSAMIANSVAESAHPLMGLTRPQVSSAFDLIVHEMKADVIALFVGGAAYVHALMLSLLGRDGASLYEADRDTRHDPWIGGVFREVPSSRFVTSNEFPSHIASMFRIQFCNDLLKNMPDENMGFAERPNFCNSLDTLIDHYVSGLHAVAEQEGLTKEWKDYLAAVFQLRPAFTTYAEDLWLKFGKKMLQNAQHGEGNVVRESILFGGLEATVNEYCEESVRRAIAPESKVVIPKFSFFHERTGSHCESALRLEIAPLAVRWHIATVINTLEGINGGLHPDRRDLFKTIVCDGLVNYLRNDGSVVSRYLMEYIVARRHLLRDIAQCYLEARPPKFSCESTLSYSQARAFCMPLALELSQNAALLKQIDRLDTFGKLPSWDERSEGAKLKAVTDWVASVIAEEDTNGRASSMLGVNNIFRNKDRSYLNALSTIAGALVANITVRDREDNATGVISGAPVGMFELGTISYRGALRIASGNESVVHKAHKKLREQNDAAVKLLNEKFAQSTPPYFTTSTLAVLGEYNFATYLRGSTPVERDLHVGKALPVVGKPRFVLQVGGDSDWGRTSCAKSIRVITLARLDMRHHWVGLTKTLRKTDAHALCFLSTGWETMVLDWACDSAKEFWDTTKALSTIADTHTVFVLPESQWTGSAAKQFMEICDTETHNERTGVRFWWKHQSRDCNSGVPKAVRVVARRVAANRKNIGGSTPATGERMQPYSV